MGFNTKKMQTSGGTPRKGVFPRSTFLSLDDTPDTYVSQAGLVCVVKNDEKQIEFKAVGVIDDHLVLVINTDTTPGTLVNKLTAGGNITFTTNNPTGNATITIALNDKINVSAAGLNTAVNAGWWSSLHPIEFSYGASNMNTSFFQHGNSFYIMQNSIFTSSTATKYVKDAPYGATMIWMIDNTMNIYHGLPGLADSAPNWRYWLYEGLGVWIWNPGYHFESGQVSIYGRYTTDMIRFNIYPEYARFNTTFGINLIPNSLNTSAYVGSFFEMKSYTPGNDIQIMNMGGWFCLSKNLYCTDDPVAQTWKLKAASAASNLYFILDTMIYAAQAVGGAADSAAVLVKVFTSSPVTGFLINPDYDMKSGSFSVKGKSIEILNIDFNTQTTIIRSVVTILGSTTPKLIIENTSTLYGDGNKPCQIDFIGYVGASGSTMGKILFSHHGVENDCASRMEIVLNYGGGDSLAATLTWGGLLTIALVRAQGASIGNTVPSLGAVLNVGDNGSTTLGCFLNKEASNADGSRVCVLAFRGINVTTPVEHCQGAIRWCHDGTGNDQKSQVVLSVNSGSDGDGYTDTLKIKSNGNTYLLGLKAFGEVGSGYLALYQNISTKEIGTGYQA
jgi:hypothetical protein